MSRSGSSLATALVLLLSAVTRSSCDRRLYQIADAPAPSGSLRTNAKQQENNGALSTTCSFNIKGEATWIALVRTRYRWKTFHALFWYRCRHDG